MFCRGSAPRCFPTRQLRYKTILTFHFLGRKTDKESENFLSKLGNNLYLWLSVFSTHFSLRHDAVRERGLQIVVKTDNSLSSPSRHLWSLRYFRKAFSIFYDTHRIIKFQLHKNIRIFTMQTQFLVLIRQKLNALHVETHSKKLLQLDHDKLTNTVLICTVPYKIADYFYDWCGLIDDILHQNGHTFFVGHVWSLKNTSTLCY
jgi:hypothetical protein